MERPSYIDLSATSSRSASALSRNDQASPRPQYFDGDIPPVLSPLDAFAAHSRRLAKELEATRLAGERRMSRLPPALVTESLSQHQANRPACFRTLSGTSPMEPVPQIPIEYRQDSGNSPAVSEPANRPVSTHTRISAVPEQEDKQEHHHNLPGNGAEPFTTARDGFAYPGHNRPAEPVDYFSVLRIASPTRTAESPQAVQQDSETSSTSKPGSQNPSSLPHDHPLHGLAPPNAAFARNKSYHESSDDDYTSSAAGSTFSQARKLSVSSGMSFPASPALPTHERTPSNHSNTSLSSLKQPRSHLNFSRPMSQSSLNAKADIANTNSRKSLERKPSYLSDHSRGLTSFEDDRSVISEGFVTGESSSYTHKAFILPRGRGGNRTSQMFQGLSTPDFKWQEPLFPGTPPLGATKEEGEEEGEGEGEFSKLSPARSARRSRDNETSSRSEIGPFSFESGAGERPVIVEQHQRPASAQATLISGRPLEYSSPYMGSSYDKSKMPTLPPIPGSTADEQSIRSKSERSASTVRPTTPRSASNYQALSTDEHVEKAIELHQHGDLKESTYHLRIAAKQNHPTGMLLYALAIRHGWGIRSNQKEGVAWLRRAVDIAMLEVADDENPPSDRPTADVTEKKSHRAQFALGIYELGISHMNGWGVETDKALALRCFEIAGTWGDVDALTEAGFCYAKGVGCKKDLKKAARFYRMAAAKGVSMVGNSWIYKDKYNDDNNDRQKSGKDSKNEEDKGRKGRSRGKSNAAEGKEKEREKERKPRDKSKTRSIFGRKRSVAAASSAVADT